ncbi:MAG: bifunctional UDP-sugar hydrolase/5'-nucleotidase, partial [Eubacteriales bacterium]
DNVTLVDAGDAVQGGAVGKLTEGEAIIQLMNEVGYDIMTPGNHEFDYQVPQMLYLMDMFEGAVIASNFIDLDTNTTIFDAYELIDYGSFQIAYVGIVTPETYTSSTPAYFQDEEGNLLYSFCEGQDGTALYATVQASVDDAISNGADYVIAIAHLGIEEAAAPYRSTDVIANTTGIDVLLDGHSHSVVEAAEIENANGDIVIVNQTGSKFSHLGKITINDNTGTITAELISSETYTDKDPEILSSIDAINETQAELLQQVVGTIDTPLIINDPETGELLVRSSETNLGNFCADALRYILDTDIALANGGGIRSDIEAGEVTYEDIIAVFPWNNNAISIEISGQVILDALEMGATAYPEENGGFLQVSGLTYSIDTSIPSSVVVDETGGFVEVNGEYRVTNVMIGDENLDLDEMYSVGGLDYLLQLGGDGMTMFEGATVIKDKYAIDNEVLMTYLSEGDFGDMYDNLYGQGRISIADGTTTESTFPIMYGIGLLVVLAILLFVVIKQTISRKRKDAA